LSSSKHHAINSLYGWGLALALVLILGVGSNALAQPTRLPNIRVIGAVQATAGTTFSTTSYADLAGATVTFTPARDYLTTGAPGEPNPVGHLHVLASLDVTKATATTGTCGVFVNGALLANTARTISQAAGEGVITLFADVTEAASGSQVVKLQCKSGDSNVFTVNLGQLYVEEFW
jgi:hypothetical protein